MTDTNKFVDFGWNLDTSYTSLPGLFYSIVNPLPVPAPSLAILNLPLAHSLGLNSDALQSESGIAVLAGNSLPPGTVSLAMAYAGHQFGHFTMLGDGRALLLGEQVNGKAERFDIQLKGSGRTPYSRGGDGRAALGPMLREYIISEAMHALGIPTSRSLAVVATGEPVHRETELPGAILTRVAASHIRVGTFEYAAEWGTKEDLKALADYTIRRHFPFPESGPPQNPYYYLLTEVVRRQASTIAQWQLAGFVHGVMNTDNMAISGETLDYGPCAFLDEYNPAQVFSSIDVTGRYAYRNQPDIAKWNCAQFARALLPLLDDNAENAVNRATNAIENFSTIFHQQWLAGIKAKLGIKSEEPQDETLVNELLVMMETYREDFTGTFTALTRGTWKKAGMFATQEFDEWHDRWQTRLKRQQDVQITELMASWNPVVIPRNHLVEKALHAAVNQGDFKIFERLLSAISNPYTTGKDTDEFAAVPLPSNQVYRTFCGT